MPIFSPHIRSIQVCDDTCLFDKLKPHCRPFSVYLFNKHPEGDDLIVTPVDGSMDLLSIIRESGYVDPRDSGQEPDLDNFRVDLPFQDYKPVVAIKVTPMGYIEDLCVDGMRGRRQFSGSLREFLDGNFFKMARSSPRRTPSSQRETGAVQGCGINYLISGDSLTYVARILHASEARSIMDSGASCGMESRIAARVVDSLYKVVLSDPSASILEGRSPKGRKFW